MARLCAVVSGPASSTGSPMTFMMRPSVSGPTGTEIGAPVLVTTWPRTRPSVESMAIVRTWLSPRCCATSRTRRLPWLLVSSAFRIAGSSPSKATSTTAPITWMTLPTEPTAFAAGVAALAIFLPSFLTSERFRARNDFNQFLGDLGLTLTVVAERQLVDHVTSVARRIVHRAHLGTHLAGDVLKK